jgi:protein-S-isoprenylcysteine O-methyltransferase Ste14
MKRFLDWANHEYSLRTRILALIPAGFLFVFLLPYTLVVLLPRLDTAFNLPSITFGAVNIIIGGLLVIMGVIFSLWSIIQQMTPAQGTPIPVMATHKLLIQGVFKYSRNPMLFGTFCAYLGAAILVGSISSMVAVILFTLLIIAYVKIFEEKELELRFGQEYLDYKASTPFFFPGVPGRKLAK